MTRAEASIARHEVSPGVGANAEVFVDLTDHGMPRRYEALRASSLGGSDYEIESIPFFVYGVARSDVVRAIVADDDLRFDRVIRRSGHRTLRVGIEDESNVDAIHEALHELVSTSGLASEWHAAGYVAVDLPDLTSEAGLLPALKDLARDGAIEFEIDG